ncbi:MAG: RNA-binding domain-containing protein [Terracidiphilus sp.]
MQSMDLVSLLSRPEGKTLEFKRDLSSPEGALKTLVAFANTSGGALLIGIEDGAKGVKGVPDILKEDERLANLIADNISPKIVPSIEVIAWRKTHVLGVEIYPSSNRPHHLNRFGPEEGVFVRVGSTNPRADLVLIEEMRRFSQVSSLDEQPMPELNSEAIDFRAASEFFRPVRKLTRHELETLKLLTKYQGRIVPTIGGVLLFGADRLNHYPDAWIAGSTARWIGLVKSGHLSLQIRFLMSAPAIMRATDDLPESFSFHLGFALHSIDYLRAKDDFEIRPTPVDVSAICQLFQACFIGQEFAGSSGSAACNSRRNQDDLAGALIDEAGGNCIVFDNITSRSQRTDLPSA